MRNRLGVLLLTTMLASTTGAFASEPTEVNQSQAKVRFYTSLNSKEFNATSDFLDISNITTKQYELYPDRIIIGELVDSAPFYRFTSEDNPYAKIGLDNIIFSNVEMEAYIEVPEDGFYFIYPLEQTIPKHENKHLSFTWSGLSYGDTTPYGNGIRTFDNIPNDIGATINPSPWLYKRLSSHEKPPFTISVSDKETFNYNIKATFDPRKPETNLLSQSVTPIKLEKGIHKLNIMISNTNIDRPGAHSREEGWETMLRKFDGFNIHMKRITRPEDAQMIDIFEDKDKTIVKLNLTGANEEITFTPKASELKVVGHPTQGWVLNADMGLEEFNITQFASMYPIDSNATQTVRFSFEAEEIGTYVFTHKLDPVFLTDHQPVEGEEVYKNCVIWGSWMDEWKTSYDIGLQKTEIENSSILDIIRQKDENIRQKSRYGRWNPDNLTTWVGGENTLLPIHIDENTVGTQVDVTFNYHCHMQPVQVSQDKDGRRVNTFLDKDLRYIPKIKVKTPSATGFNFIE